MRAYGEDSSCVGEAVLGDGRFIALTIWGDDPFTPEKDGLSDGESFTIHVSEDHPAAASTGTVLQFTLDESETFYAGDPAFQKDAIFMVDRVIRSSPTEQDCSLAASTAFSAHGGPDASHRLPPTMRKQMNEAASSGEDSQAFYIYPNPAADSTRLVFAAPYDWIVTIESYDMMGRRVFVPYDVESAIDCTRVVRLNTGHLASGAYIIRVDTPRGRKDAVVHVIN